MTTDPNNPQAPVPPPSNAYINMVDAATTAVDWMYTHKMRTLFAVIVLSFCWTMYKHTDLMFGYLNTLQHTISPSPEVEGKRAEAEQRKNNILQPAIENVRAETDADRLTYYGYHNNASGLAGDHWLYVTSKGGAVSEGIADMGISANADNLPFYMFHDIIEGTTPSDGRTTCMKSTREDLKSSQLRGWYKRFGTTLIYACGVRDANGVQRGFITNTYVRRAPPVSDQVIFENLQNLAVEINKTITENKVR